MRVGNSKMSSAPLSLGRSGIFVVMAAAVSMTLTAIAFPNASTPRVSSVVEVDKSPDAPCIKTHGVSICCSTAFIMAPGHSAEKRRSEASIMVG